MGSKHFDEAVEFDGNNDHGSVAIQRHGNDERRQW